MELNQSLLADYDIEIKKVMQEHNKDYMRVFCGYEGEGKSLLAAAEALRFNPDFNVKTQAVYSLKQFLDFQDMYAESKGRVCFMDEAALQLLGEDSNTKEAKMFKKIFITHRNKGHIYLLCTPSPFLMMPYIRKWRIRDCILVYTNSLSPNMDRQIAYYNRLKYSNFITSKPASDLIMTPSKFTETYEPTINPFKFNMITDEKVLALYREMDAKKTEAQKDLRKEARDFVADGEDGGKRADRQVDKTLRNNLIFMAKNNGWQTTEIANATGLTASSIRGIINYEKK